MTDIIVPLSGWGRGTWDECAWNTYLSVDLTGVAGTGAVGKMTKVVMLQVYLKLWGIC